MQTRKDEEEVFTVNYVMHASIIMTAIRTARSTGNGWRRSVLKLLNTGFPEMTLDQIDRICRGKAKLVGNSRDGIYIQPIPRGKIIGGGEVRCLFIQHPLEGAEE